MRKVGVLKLPKVRPTRFTLLLFLVTVLMVGQASAAITPPLAQNKYMRQVVLDSSGNAIVSGFNDGALAQDWNYLIIKYDSADNRLWSRSYNGPKDGVDEITAITVDKSQNIYVTGYSDSGRTLSRYDFATIKYSEKGTRRWITRYDGAKHAEDRGQSVAVYKSKIVYVLGKSPGLQPSQDYALQRLNGDSGNQNWVALYGR